MESDYNRLVGLSLENFRAFARRQEIPLRPITLLYGQNSSGKSAILKALRWLKDLRDGNALGDLPRHIHRFNEGQMLGICYELALSEHHPGKEATSLMATLWQTIHNIRFEATLATYQQVSALLQQAFPGLPLPPPAMSCIWQASISVDAKPYLRLETAFRPCVRETPEYFTFDPVLRVGDLATDHPLTPALLMQAKRQALSELETRIQQMESTTAKLAASPTIDPTARPFADPIRECKDMMAKLTEFDVHTCRRDDILDAVHDLHFQPDAFPPRARFVNPSLTNWVIDATPADEPGRPLSCHEMQMQMHLPKLGTAEALVLEHFVSLLAVTTHRLAELTQLNQGNDPLAELLHIPPTRSIPSQPFLITDSGDRARHAPDWPSADAKAFSKVNSWLASLNRADTNYRLLCEPLEIFQGPDDHVEKKHQLRFSGVLDVVKGVTVHFDELGVGFSQLVPILLAAFNSDDSLVLIEQPELHLHPALQCELADLFTKAALTPLRTDDFLDFKQLIIETHSEHLLLRIMRRIRETTEGKLPESVTPVRPSDVAVLYVENHGDHSTVSEMPINEQGELTRDWPGGFFEEGLRELLM